MNPFAIHPEDLQTTARGPLPPLGAAEHDLPAARTPGGGRIRFRRTEPDSPAAPREEQDCALDDVRLAIGDRVQLESRTDGVRHLVQLVGYLRQASVIVTNPTAGERAVLVRDGQDFVVRLFTGRGVFAFAATVLKAPGAPFPHVHLSWPSQVRGFLLREAYRAEVELIASAAGRHIGPVAGIIDNLSPGGALLRTRVALGQKGDPVRVKFRVALDGRETLIAAEAQVRALSERERDGVLHFEHGLRLVGLSPLQHTQLEAYVYKVLLDAAR